MTSYVLPGLCVLMIFPLLSYCCTTQLSPVYSQLSGSASFKFSITPPSAYTKYNIRNKDDVPVLRITYSPTPGYIDMDDTINTFTGDTSTGDLSITLKSVQQDDYGVYNLIRGPTILQCQKLYILGKPTTPTLGSKTDPVIGGTVTVTCTSASTTVPSDHGLSMRYSWTVDGATNPTDSRYTYSTSRHTLTLSDVTKDDSSKVFRCTATEVITGGLTSDTSNTYSMNVLYGPDTVTLKPSTASYTEDEGTTLSNIQCSADCNPSCAYRWTNQGQITVVSTSGILSLGSLERSEAGTYTCTATNPQKAGTQTAQVVIIVRYGPDTVILNPSTVSYTEHEGTNISDIQCSADCNPSCTYRWTKQGQTTAVRNTGILNLGPLNRSEAGTYTCTASNPQKAGTQTTQIVIIVRYGPDTITLNPSAVSYTGKEGTSLSNIRCSAECYPSCTYRWTKQGQTTAVNITGTLSLGSLQRSETGSYICTATNPQKAETQTSQVVINIRYAPGVTISLSSSNLIEHSSVQLGCNADGVPNTYNYTAITQTWKGTTIPHTRPPVSNTPVHSSLQFTDLQLQDTGIYTCHVNNGVIGLHGKLDQTASVPLHVKVSPDLLLKKTFSYAGSIHAPINITIPFYSYPEISSVSLHRADDLNVTDDATHFVSYKAAEVATQFYGTDVILNGYILEFYINSLLEEDFTSYKLTLQNSIGLSEATISIIHESIPESPAFFRFIGLIDNIPQVFWVKGFNGGSKQYFVIETTLTASGDWVEQVRIDEDDKMYYIQPIESYIANITGLSPGHYMARLIAGNEIGQTVNSEELGISFLIPKRDSECLNKEHDAENNVEAIVGGVGASVIVINVVAVVIFFLQRRRSFAEMKSSSDHISSSTSKPRQRAGTFNNETFEDNPVQIGVDDTTFDNEIGHSYESLQERMVNSETYETMTTPSSNKAHGHVSKEYENL